MKRVLITGGTGFVGSNLARRLVRDGHRVHLVVRPGHATWRIQPIAGGITLLDADLADGASVERVVAQAQPDWIFHLAAFGAYPHQTDVETMVQTNVRGTCNLVAAALEVGVEALVNAGSSSEYGYKDHAPSEAEPLEPNSSYAWAKASATLFCRHAAHQRGAHMPTLRLYSVYGPYEEPGRLLPSLIASGLRGELPPLVDPRVARDYVYVEDVADAFVRAAERRGPDPGAVYNVGTGVQTSLAEIVEVARRRLGVAGEPRWGSMPNRSWDTDVWVSDIGKIRHDLGWQPATTLEEGFGRFVDWCCATPQVRALYDAAIRRAIPAGSNARSHAGEPARAHGGRRKQEDR